METIVIETENREQSETVKAILKALKVKFKALEDTSEAKRIAESVAEGYREAMEIESGKTKAKTFNSLKELLDEL